MGLDVFLLIVVVLAFLSGYKRGVIFMVFFLAGITLGIFASLKLSYITTEYLYKWFNIAEGWMPVLSLVVSFLVVFLAARFIAQMLEKFLSAIQLNFINKIIGGALGALIGFAVISIGFWYLSNLNFFTEELIANSKVFPTSIEFAPMFVEQFSKVLPFMNDLFESLQLMFDEISINKTNIEQ